ncbi:MAG: hypothetical protein C0401_02800 [Anaerolinea sp.]|nr:hypothetical protein [Anaerolinea sp.]
MRILYFTRSQSPHDVRFTKALAQTTHQVFVLCLERDMVRQWPEGVTEIKWKGLRPGQGWGQTLRLVQQLKKVIVEVRPDLIHAGPIQRVAFLVALAGFHPLISMSWGTDLLLEADQNPFWRWVTRFTLERTDILVGDCIIVGRKAASFGVSPDRYKMFPWGVDLAHFKPEGSALLRERLGWQDKMVLLSNRSLEPLYGVEDVVNAFILSAQSNPDLRLLLYSKGSQEARIQNLIHENGVEDKVFFGGLASVEELPDVYRSADLYLSASHSDGSSVSLMEALACGLPVIVSDIPGNQEWVTDGEHGRLFADKNIVSLAEKILKTESDTGVLLKMKKKNRELAEQRADWKMNFQVLLDAYNLAIEYARKGER